MAVAQLQSMASRLGPGAKLPGVVELAASLGISKGTLHVALRDLEECKILRMEHGHGIYVAAGARRILLVVYDASFLGSRFSEYWTLFFARIHSRAATDGYELKLEPWDESSAAGPGVEQLRQFATSNPVRGVMLVGLNIAQFRLLEPAGLPLVSHYGHAPLRVTNEFHSAFDRAIWELIRSGCQRLGYWMGPFDKELNRQVFLEKLRIDHLTFHPELVRYYPSDGQKELVAAGRNLALQVFGGERASWPDGLYIGDDYVTQGALEGLRELDLTVGKDVRIATLSVRGSKVLAGSEEQMIRLEFDPAEAADTMFQLIDDVALGRPVHGEVRSLQPRHIPRESP